jgi:hypothetical protein
MSASKSKTKKKNNAKRPGFMKGIVLFLIGILLVLGLILKASLWKDYPVEGQKQLLAISNGETYSGFIDRSGQRKSCQLSDYFKAVSAHHDS